MINWIATTDSNKTCTVRQIFLANSLHPNTVSICCPTCYILCSGQAFMFLSLSDPHIQTLPKSQKVPISITIKKSYTEKQHKMKLLNMMTKVVIGPSHSEALAALQTWCHGFKNSPNASLHNLCFWRDLEALLQKTIFKCTVIQKIQWLFWIRELFCIKSLFVSFVLFIKYCITSF